MNKLIMTVGLPHSGKSTWAKKQGLPIINPDAIRLALHGQAFIPQAESMVWTMAHYMANALFLAGHETLILDATNVTLKRRVEWVGAKYPMAVTFEKQIFTASPKVCIDRAKADNRFDLIPVIERMMNEWDMDVPEEWCTAEFAGGPCDAHYRCVHSPKEA